MILITRLQDGVVVERGVLISCRLSIKESSPNLFRHQVFSRLQVLLSHYHFSIRYCRRISASWLKPEWLSADTVNNPSVASLSGHLASSANRSSKHYHQAVRESIISKTPSIWLGAIDLADSKYPFSVGSRGSASTCRKRLHRHTSLLNLWPSQDHPHLRQPHRHQPRLWRLRISYKPQRRFTARVLSLHNQRVRLGCCSHLSSSYQHARSRTRGHRHQCHPDHLVSRLISTIRTISIFPRHLSCANPRHLFHSKTRPSEPTSLSNPT